LAGTLTVVIALAVALFFYRMPVDRALASAVYGFFYGLWPIAWIIIGAVFLYKVSVKTGQFDIIRSSILSITEDQRLQMLLVGFSFGAFLEGAAGFGAPVAITAALLVGLGFRPLYAAGLCLIVNTAPVAFGALGIPIIVAGQVTGIDASTSARWPAASCPSCADRAVLDHGDHGRLARREGNLAGGAGGRRFVRAVAVPDLQLHRPGTAGHHFLAGVAGVPDRVPQALETRAHLPLRARAGRDGARRCAGRCRPPLHDRPDPESVVAVLDPDGDGHGVEPQAVQGAVRQGRPAGRLGAEFPVPHLHQLVQKMPPVVREAMPYDAVYKFDWLSATGTAILIAAVIAIALLKMKPKAALATFGETVNELRLPIYSIGMVLAFAFIANYSGLSATLALALAHTGKAFTFFSPFLGWLGVFLTGSDTSANALFSALQATTAQQIGVPKCCWWRPTPPAA
jgi:L-lactate permease